MVRPLNFSALKNGHNSALTRALSSFFALYSDLCRKKKIKCDGGIPVCGNCQAFNYECSYNDMTKKVGDTCLSLSVVARSES